MWIQIALLAMLANVGKVLIVNRLCRGIDSRLLVLSSRLLAGLFLLPVYLLTTKDVPSEPVFWLVVATTAVLTAIASILFTRSLQSRSLSLVMASQSTVPVFALVTLLFSGLARPGLLSVVLMLITMLAVGYVLYVAHVDKNRKISLIPAMFSLIAAVIFGICTVLDRAAVAAVAHGALAYSAFWNIASVFVVGAETARAGSLRHWPGNKKLFYIIFYGTANLIVFFLQQLAVEKSLTIPGAVVNVKAILLMSLGVIVIMDSFVFEPERRDKRIVAGSLIAVVSGILLIYTLTKS